LTGAVSRWMWWDSNRVGSRRPIRGSFVWSKTRFPDAPGFVQRMNGNHLHVNLWEKPVRGPKARPCIRRLSRFLPRIRSGSVRFPDLNIPAAAEIERKHHQEFGVNLGVSGYKIDEVDGVDTWLWPDHAAFPSGIPGDQMRQVYGVFVATGTDQTVPCVGKTKPSDWCAARTGGASRFPFALYSDTYDHREYVTGITSAGLAGVMCGVRRHGRRRTARNGYVGCRPLYCPMSHS